MPCQRLTWDKRGEWRIRAREKEREIVNLEAANPCVLPVVLRAFCSCGGYSDSPDMNSLASFFSLEVETFQKVKFARRTMRLAVRSFLSWERMVSLMAASAFKSPLGGRGP